MTAISIQNLHKSFASNRAVNEVSLNINRGELFGLIGPDGAGKTSLMRLIASLLLPDSGSVHVFGFDTRRDYRSIRKQLGYMPGRFSLYPDLTVEENLHFWATVFGTTIDRHYHLIEQIYKPLEPFKKRKAGQLSGGMKQKLALSCALIHSPSLLLLDEPTTGVDAVSRMEFWDMLQGLKGKDMTLLVSTPYMDEADLCDRIALMQQGKILSAGNPHHLRTQFIGRLWEVKTPQIHPLKQRLNALFGCEVAHLFGQSLHWTCQADMSIDKVEQVLKQFHIPIDSLREIEPGIEDCFIQIARS